MDITLTIDSSPIALTIGSASGAIGPAPGGTGLVSVTAGVLDTPTTLSARVAADATNLRNQLGLGTAATTAATAYATAAQGATADSAVQPGDLGNSAGLDVGTTAGTVAAGDDTRLTDARTPTAHEHAWGDITSGVPATFPPTIGSGAADAVAGNDSRLTDARTPTAHKSSHATGGSDALSPADIGAIPTSAKSTGGNGAADSGKVVSYNSLGGFDVGNEFSTAPGSSHFVAVKANATTVMSVECHKDSGFCIETALMAENAKGVSVHLTQPGHIGMIIDGSAADTSTHGVYGYSAGPVFTAASEDFFERISIWGTSGGFIRFSTETGSVNDAFRIDVSAAVATGARLIVFPDRSGGVALTTGETHVNPTITNYTESVVSIGTVTSSHTLALTNGTRQRVRLTASTACTFTMPTPTDGKSFVLEVEQAATTGLGTAVFTGVDWGNAGAPTITPTASKKDFITFMADGVKWSGQYAQGFSYTP